MKGFTQILIYRDEQEQDEGSWPQEELRGQIDSVQICGKDNDGLIVQVRLDDGKVCEILLEDVLESVKHALPVLDKEDQ